MGAKYYVASYSVHASLLEQIASKKDDSIEKLYVSYGGLKVPKGSFDESLSDKLFKGLGKSSRVLHAKVILKEKASYKELWLWTGNLRRGTRYAQNALMSISLTSGKAKIVRDWFERFPEKNLIVTINSSEKLTIEPTTKSILSQLKKSIVSLPGKEKLKCSIFSPWGSTDVLKELLYIERIQEVCLYTRFADGRLWIDYDDEKIRERKMAQEEAPFPHTKCMFLQNAKGKIVWAYIGSANFTNQGMKKNIKEGANIEYALIMEGESNCKSLRSVLESLNDDKQWIKRNKKKVSLDKIDESNQEFDDELDVVNPVDTYKEDRELQKKCEKLISKEQQEEFDKFYYCDDTDPHPFKDNAHYYYKVMGVGTFYNLLVQKKEIGRWYEISVKRTLKTALPFNSKDANSSVENIYKILNDEKSGTGKIGSEKEKKETEPRPENFLNVRFPYGLFVGKKGRVKMDKVEKELLKMDLHYKSLTEGQAKLIDLWLPLIRRMNGRVYERPNTVVVQKDISVFEDQNDDVRSVCKAQSDCILSLAGLMKKFARAKPNGWTRVMSVSIPTGWGKTRIAIQSVLRATKSMDSTVILYPQRNDHIKEIWQRPKDWMLLLNSQFYFSPNWHPLDEKGGGDDFLFYKNVDDDWVEDVSVAEKKSISDHLQKHFYCIVNRKEKKRSHKNNREKKLKSGTSPIFFIIDEWHARDYLKKYEDYCAENNIESGEDVEVFWREKLLGVKTKKNLFILLLSATPIAATSRMDRLYEFATDSTIAKESRKDFDAFNALTGPGNQNRDGNNQYKIYGIYPKVLECKTELLLNEKKSQEEKVVNLQEQGLKNWQKDFLKISKEIFRSKKKNAKKEQIIYQREQSVIISKKHLKLESLFSLLNLFPKRKFLIFCVYRDEVAKKLFKRIERKYGCNSVKYLNNGNRKTTLNDFNSSESKLKYLIATDRDSQGIDLQQSDAWIIHYELPWNPIRVIQRFGRVWRFNPNASSIDDELTCPVAFYIPSTYSAEEEKINRLRRRWETLNKLPNLSSKCPLSIGFDIALGVRATPSPYIKKKA